MSILHEAEKLLYRMKPNRSYAFLISEQGRNSIRKLPKIYNKYQSPAYDGDRLMGIPIRYTTEDEWDIPAIQLVEIVEGD